MICCSVGCPQPKTPVVITGNALRTAHATVPGVNQPSPRTFNYTPIIRLRDFLPCSSDSLAIQRGDFVARSPKPVGILVVQITMPPSTWRTAPVVKLAASDAK